MNVERWYSIAVNGVMSDRCVISSLHRVDMSNYRITEYTKEKAKELGVTVRRSSNPQKKMDVFKDGKKVASVGGAGYKDFPTYLREDGAKIAEEKRRLYKLRHEKDRKVVGSPGWYAWRLLWA